MIRGRVCELLWEEITMTVKASILSKEYLFKAYNLAKKCGRFESGRLHRALGIAQRSTTVILSDGRIDVEGATNDFHLATWQSCDCYDYRRHGESWWCKHRISHALLVRAFQIQERT